MTRELYRQVASITEEYLGPAAERFISRQISFHLDKKPQELTADDLPKLTEWTKVTFGLLTEDRHMIDEYTNRMMQLGRAENV
ncbi:MAG: hypothetical protein JWN01_220 [Patescibacteria group bacterium]|nr:hypothetical protein [Patescibacteria group bacterium]